MYSIGDIAQLAGITQRMLRHYDELGLFRPDAVDPNGYRRYAPARLPELHRILALKDLGFTLEQVGRLVGDDVSADELRGMLRLRLAELEAERTLVDVRLARVKRHIDRLESTSPTAPTSTSEQPPIMSTITITTIATAPVRIAEMTAVSPSFDPSDIGRTISPLYPELLARLSHAGVELTGVPIAYYEDEPEGDGVLVHAAAPIAPGITELAGLDIVDLPGLDQAVCATHHGDIARVVETVTAMLEWATDHGLVTVGYTREIYHACPDDPADWVTEIQLPVTSDPDGVPAAWRIA